MLNNLESIDFYDFYFNGHYLSEFSGVVASNSGAYTRYNLLASRAYITDRPLNSNKVMVFGSNLEPKTWEIPVLFSELDDDNLKAIKKWLSKSTPTKFNFAGDNTFCYAVIDSGALEIEMMSLVDGLVVLRFIAHNPFSYAMEEKSVSVSGLAINTVYPFTNNSTVDDDDEQMPLKLEIACSGDISFSVLDDQNNVLSQTNITGVVGGVKIDTELMTCTLFSGANHFSKIDTFPKTTNGNFKIKFTAGTLNNMLVKYREIYY